MAKKKPLLSSPKSNTHLRRCHICATLNEVEGGGVVKACTACGKHMAPFYFFDDEGVPLHSDFGLRPEMPVGKVRPVIGFTAYW